MVFYIFAAVQSFIHLFFDYDHIPLSTALPPKPETTARGPISPRAQVKKELEKQIGPLGPLFQFDQNDVIGTVLCNVLIRTVVVSLLSPFLYGLFIRKAAWSWSLSLAALIADVPATRLSYIPPHYPSLIYRSLTAGFMLSILFEASNALFSAQVARSPLKKGQPLTATSKDPNSSLSTGLRSRKDIPKVGELMSGTMFKKTNSE